LYPVLDLGVEAVGGGKNLQDLLGFEYLFGTFHGSENVEDAGLYVSELDIVLDVRLVEFLQLLVFLGELNGDYQTHQLLLELRFSY
jgi:hypothetical protein